MPLIESKIYNNSFSEVYEKLVETSRNNDYATRNLLDYLYHQNYYKIISTVLSRQKNTSILQKLIL